MGFGVGLGVGSGTGLGYLDTAGSGLPGRSAATSLRICVIQAAVIHAGYVGGTIRRWRTSLPAVFPSSSTSAGRLSRGRSVQAAPLAAPKSAGAERMLCGPSCARIASSRICWRFMRP